MVSNKKLFITGGAGFIATSLIKRLISSNEIIVYDNFSRNALKESGLWNHSNIRVIQGDILDYKFLKNSIPQDIDIVLHMAAIAGIDTVIKNSVMTMEVNMIGTYHLLKAIKELNLLERIDRFINFSTSEVFGINAFRVNEKSSTNLQHCWRSSLDLFS
ncbi:MAG: NAD-dependent epimerase/dehydratase family protein [bacterium]